MSMKNLGSKLASGVHKVKLKREQASHATPKKSEPVTKPPAKVAAPSAPVAVAAKPVAPRAAQQTAANLEKLHPSRVWPD